MARSLASAQSARNVTGMWASGDVVKTLSAAPLAVLHGARDDDSSLGPNFGARLGDAGDGRAQDSGACAACPTSASAARYRCITGALVGRPRAAAFFTRTAPRA